MVLWIVAFGGVMSSMDAFGAAAGFVVRFARNVRQLMFANGLLCLIGNFALANDFAEIATISPIIKDLTEKNVKGSPEAMYKLALRNGDFCRRYGGLRFTVNPVACLHGVLHRDSLCCLPCRRRYSNNHECNHA